MISWCHHIHHHSDGVHTVHHCGGNHHHEGYTITHCRCGLHSIDTEYARIDSHAANELPVIVQFTSACPDSGWHVESAVVRARGQIVRLLNDCGYDAALADEPPEPTP
ncbi:MAG: hypothetical protein WC565_07875 [Parcubacteria group bacterium]